MGLNGLRGIGQHFSEVQEANVGPLKKKGRQVGSWEVRWSPWELPLRSRGGRREYRTKVVLSEENPTASDVLSWLIEVLTEADRQPSQLVY